MSDIEHCQSCGAEISSQSGNRTFYQCGSHYTLPNYKYISDVCDLRRELNFANARITTIQTQLDQRWEMMRALEVECGTKDVAEAVKYIKMMKAQVVALVYAGEALNNAIWSVQDWGGTYVGDCSSKWEKVKGQQ